MFFLHLVSLFRSRFYPLICALAFCAAAPAACQAKASRPSTPLPISNLSTFHRQMRDAFWRTENTRLNQIETPTDVEQLFVPLPANDPLRKEYSRAASAADDFIQLADANKTQNWMRPAVLYLGGLSKYSLGDSAGALQLLERLQAEFPDYKRDYYINDRNLPEPEYSSPAAPGVSKLIFYLRLQVALNHAPDTFGSLKQITQDALNTLAAQREYARLLLSRSDKYNPMYFSEARFGREPDQLRAAALPSTTALVETAWDALIEKSLQQAGAQALRQWLRDLSTPDAPLANAALYRLADIETVFMASLKNEAETALEAKQYDIAANALRRLRTEFGDSETAKEFATTGLNTVTHAFKEQGDVTFNTDNGRPQTEANEIYKKMIEVAEAPAAKGYALFRLAQTVGTMGNYQEGIDYLDQSIAIWNAMPPDERPPFTDSVRQARRVTGPEPDYYIEDAYYYRAFYIAFGLKRDDEGVRLMNEFVEQFPESLYVAECLHNIILIYRWSGRRKEAATACRVLIATRPDGVRAENARDMLAIDYKKY